MVNVLLTRLLLPSEMGAYLLALSLVTFGAQAGTLGLTQVAVRFVAENVGLGKSSQVRGLIELVFKLGALGALGAGVVYWIFGGLLATRVFSSPALAAVSGLVGVWIVVMAVQLLLSETFRGFHSIDMAAIFGGLATWTMLAVCLGILWLFDGRASLATVMLLAVASGLANVLLAGGFLRRKLSGFASGGERLGSSFGATKVLRIAAPLLVSNLALLALMQIDLWVLGSFRSQEEVAVYGAAARTVLLVALPLLIINAIVPPLIAEMHAQGRRQELEHTVRATVTVALLPTLAAVIVLVLTGGEVLRMLFGDYYVQGASVLALLCVGHLVNVWAGPCGTALTMTGHQTTMMTVTLLTGAVALCSMLWVVRDYGALGVAAVAAASISLQNVALLLLARKQSGIWTHASFSVSFVRQLLGRRRA
jgi:O-antigen/teichoic acid export membrane protein